MPLPKKSDAERAAILARVRAGEFRRRDAARRLWENRGTREIAHPAPEAAPAARDARARANATVADPVPAPGVRSPPTPPSDPDPPPVRGPHDAATDEGVARLVDMGFDPVSSREALFAAGGSVERALDALMTAADAAAAVETAAAADAAAAAAARVSDPDESARRDAAQARATEEFERVKRRFLAPDPPEDPRTRAKPSRSKPNAVEELTEEAKLERYLRRKAREEETRRETDERNVFGLLSAMEEYAEGGDPGGFAPEFASRSASASASGSGSGSGSGSRSRATAARGGEGAVVGVGVSDGDGDGGGVRDQDRHRDETAPSRSSKLGTVACTHWKKKKKCPHGRKCGFRHGENDDRFNERVGDPRFRELGGGLCRFFAQGFCASGKLCEDSHAHVATVGYPEAEGPSEVSGSSEAPAQNTTACSEWLRSGKCANGDRCAHLHREIDPRVNSLVNLPRFRHLLPKGVMCRDFGKGYCARGADCNFGHAHVATRGYPRAEDPSKWRGGDREGEEEEKAAREQQQCPDWLRSGKCANGDRCAHLHREIDPRVNSLVNLPRFRHLVPPGVVCMDFRKGYCARGADCKFGHAHVATRGYPRAEDPSKWPKMWPILGPRDPGYGESQCPDWVWNDVCPRGNQCEHSHYHTNESIAARIAASLEPRSSVTSDRSDRSNRSEGGGSSRGGRGGEMDAMVRALDRAALSGGKKSGSKKPATSSSASGGNRTGDGADLSREMECCSCMERPRSSVFFPCGHTDMCYDCASRWCDDLKKRGEPWTCPTCRHAVDDLRRVHIR